MAAKNSMPTLKITTSAAVLAIRYKRGENQSELWNRIGVTQSGGSRYESGRSIPKPVQLLLQVAYGTTIGQKRNFAPTS